MLQLYKQILLVKQDIVYMFLLNSNKFKIVYTHTDTHIS